MCNLHAVHSKVYIFSSDNGAPPASADVNHADGEWIARNWPYRGHKALIWDGGTRVAGFISSPLLPASVRGTEWHGLMHITDWLPTIVGLAGGSLAKNFALDGAPPPPTPPLCIDMCMRY